MAAFDRLPNDLQPGRPCGPQYNQLHAARRSRTSSAFGPSVGVVSHIEYRLLYSIKDATISPCAEGNKASLQITSSGAAGRGPPPALRGSHAAAAAEPRPVRNNHLAHRNTGAAT